MEADLAGIDLKYLSREKSRHGKTVFYARLNGKRIRIKAAEGAPEFIAVDFRLELTRDFH